MLHGRSKSLRLECGDRIWSPRSRYSPLCTRAMSAKPAARSLDSSVAGGVGSTCRRCELAGYGQCQRSPSCRVTRQPLAAASGVLSGHRAEWKLPMAPDQETGTQRGEPRGRGRCCWCDRAARRARCVPRFWRGVRRRSDGSPAQTPHGDAGPAGSGRPRRAARTLFVTIAGGPEQQHRGPGRMSTPPSDVSAGTVRIM